MQGNNGVDSFKCALYYHFKSAATGLFGRLKNASPAHREWSRAMKRQG
jgi:hypothetical protein